MRAALRHGAATGLLLTALAACGGGRPVEESTGPEPSSPLVNGCLAATATDARGRPEVEIRFGGMTAYAYDPACVTVSTGTRLTFVGDFVTHPLAPGRIVRGMPAPLGETPIRQTETGERASFDVTRPGAYGFFCDIHVAEGMMGAVFVEE